MHKYCYYVRSVKTYRGKCKDSDPMQDAGFGLLTFALKDNHLTTLSKSAHQRICTTMKTPRDMPRRFSQTEL